MPDADSDEDSDFEEDEDEDPNKLWCICQQPHNNRFMICCDSCSGLYCSFFHSEDLPTFDYT